MTNFIRLLPPELLVHAARFMDHRDQSALARTSRYCHDVVNRVLYNDNFRLDMREDSCVLWAAEKGNLDTMKAAHRYGADLSVMADMSRYWGAMPLAGKGFCGSSMSLALRNRHDHVFYYLLEHMVHFDLPTRGCCSCGLRPSPISTVESEARFPLHYAIRHRPDNRDLAAALVRRGVYLSSKSVSALFDAVEAERLDLVEVLLQHPNITVTDLSYKGDSVFHHAINVALREETYYRLIKMCVEAGVPVDIRSSHGLTPLASAFRHQMLAAVEVLLTLGADPRLVLRNGEGFRPLHLVTLGMARFGWDVERSFGVLKALVEAGEDVNECTGNISAGYGPPLFFALDFGNEDVDAMKYLLENGARTDIPVMMDIGGRDYPRYIIEAWLAKEDRHRIQPYLDEEEADSLGNLLFRPLLRNGTPIGPVEGDWYLDGEKHSGDGHSALLYACRDGARAWPYLLQGLLRHATRANVSLEHLREALITDFSEFARRDPGLGEPSVCVEIKRLIMEFIAREYPEAT